MGRSVSKSITILVIFPKALFLKGRCLGMILVAHKKPSGVKVLEENVPFNGITGG